MNILTDLVFYKENQISIRSKISYYRKLGISSLIIPSPGKTTEESIDDLCHISNLFWQADIIVFVEVDPIEACKDLLGTDIIDWKDPKIRSGFYKFINYLSKYGTRGIYYKNLEKLWAYSNGSYQQFDNFIRELGKNTLQNKQSLAIASINTDDKKLQKIILDSGIYNFDGVEIEDRGYDDLLDFKKSIADKDLNLGHKKLSDSSKSLMKLTNFKNFPYQSQTLAAGLNFFLNSYPVINKNEEFGSFIPKQNSNDYNLLKESEQILDYYKKLIEIRRDNLALRQELLGRYLIMIRTY